MPLHTHHPRLHAPQDASETQASYHHGLCRSISLNTLISITHATLPSSSFATTPFTAYTNPT